MANTSEMEIEIRDDRNFSIENILSLYRANNWSSAEKPNELYKALMNSHAVVTAWHEDQLIGLGNAISDGHLVVYYPHLIVHPSFQRQGIGKAILQRLKAKYAHFHQQALIADSQSIEFYKKVGFVPAGNTQPLWIYHGNEH